MMRWLAILAVLACLAAAGCAQDDKHPDDNGYGGFYGGVIGGKAF
jgi:hypothetical protein